MQLSNFYPEKVFKYCPFCGAFGFTWDGHKALFCGQCGKQLFWNPAGAVAAIIENSQGDILLVRRKFDPAKGLLGLPGGFVDLREGVLAALHREVLEEVNLTITGQKFWQSFCNEYLFNGVVYFTLDLVFLCTVADFSTLRAGDDADSAEFYPKGKIKIEDIGLNSAKDIIAQYLKK